MRFNNRWKVILIASFLAWFMEYSLRGVNNLLRVPEMTILVFANYFIYLVLIEDFICRFKLKDYQVWIVAQFFGLLWQLVSVAGVYYPPFVFGIGLGTLLINNLVWNRISNGVNIIRVFSFPGNQSSYPGCLTKISNTRTTHRCNTTDAL